MDKTKKEVFVRNGLSVDQYNADVARVEGEIQISYSFREIPSMSYLSLGDLRCTNYHSIVGVECRIPREVVYAMCLVKKVCAENGCEGGMLDGDVSRTIGRAADGDIPDAQRHSDEYERERGIVEPGHHDIGGGGGEQGSGPSQRSLQYGAEFE